MNEYCKIINSINELPDVSYEGYVWMSDEEEPRKIRSINEIVTKETNPFIVEGFMKGNDGKVSISLTSVNGSLKIYQYNLEAINDLHRDQKTEASYLTQRFEKAKIKFITVWLPIKDENCEGMENYEGMEVLQPQMRVFNGFEQ